LHRLGDAQERIFRSQRKLFPKVHVQLPPEKEVAGKKDQKDACEKERKEKGEKSAKAEGWQEEKQSAPPLTWKSFLQSL
jgi:hypothetical protein